MNTTADLLTMVRDDIKAMRKRHERELEPLLVEEARLEILRVQELKKQGADILWVTTRGAYEAPHSEGLGDRTFWLTPGLWVWNRGQGRYDRVP